MKDAFIKQELQIAQEPPFLMSNYVYYEEGVTAAEISEARLELSSFCNAIDLDLFELLIDYENDRRRLQDKN